MLPAYLVALVLCAAQPSQPMPLVGISPEQEPTAKDLDIRGLADRLTRSVAGLDPASRSLWVELSRKDPAHATLAETLPELARIPFLSGTMIPTDEAIDDTLPGHLCLPTATGMRVAFEDESELQITIDPSGVFTSIAPKEGKAIPTWAETVVGLKWSATKPHLIRREDVRKALGVKPPMNLYQDRPVYWLPGDHVAFGDEIWSYGKRMWCSNYSPGASEWGDALYDNQPAARCQSNLRTRIAPGNGSYAATAFCRDGASPRLFLIWMRSTRLEGRTIEKFVTLEQRSQTIPFEFVPWGKERSPHLLVIAPNRLPSLLKLTSERAEEVAKGRMVPEGLEIGAPTWYDINEDGLLEILAPVTDEAGALSIIVLLAEAKTVESSGK